MHNLKVWTCKLCGKEFTRADTVLYDHLKKCPKLALKPNTPGWRPAVKACNYQAYLLNPDSPAYLAPPSGSYSKKKKAASKKKRVAMNNPADSTSSSVGANKSQREKKESLKKREAHDTEAPANAAEMSAPAISPTRMITSTPLTPAEFDLPRGPVYVPSVRIKGRLFNELTERPNTHKGFKFGLAIADPAFPHSHYFRYTESEPYGPRFSHQDTSKTILFDAKGTAVANPSGFVAARANVGMQEGSHCWEVKVIRGIRPEDADLCPAPHVRIGIGRPEASLENPVGQDSYSYGIRDVAFDRVHIARPTKFIKEKTDIDDGDVISFVLTLPSLELHRKVVAGTYNKAVDVTDSLEPKSAAGPDIIRDRAKINYKGDSFIEQFEYCGVKELDHSIRNSGQAHPVPANPNHEKVALRTLPFSSLKVYKNGKYMGEPFTDLLAFLPPASKFSSAAAGKERDSFDDGSLGYFPMVSPLYGGAVEINCGPHFKYPLPGLIIEDDNPAVDTTTTNKGKGKGKAVEGYIRPLSVRYDEQIAEDITYDIIDEVDFWLQDGGMLDDEEMTGETEEEEWEDVGDDEATDTTMIDPVLLAADAEVAAAGGMLVGGLPEDTAAGDSEMADAGS